MPTFLTPSQCATQYFQVLKSIKPDLNTNDNNSDFVIRGKTISGVVSGLYGDLGKINNDPFISTARATALTIIGQDYAIPQQPATQASGSAAVTISGTNGTVINPGDLTFLYAPTNILYTNTTGGTIVGGVLTVSVQCLVAGQIGNIASPDTFTVVSPPTGVTGNAAIVSTIGNGSDAETTDSYRSRLLTRRQNAPAGGNETDYPEFAFQASSAVRSAAIYRFVRGLGTVGVYVTAGTTNIDAAVTAGESVVRIPTSDVINTIQNYYNAVVPLTDCPFVYSPTELDINVTVNVIYAAGLTSSSVPSDSVNNPLGLTCQQLVQREISRVLYKYAVGGRPLPGKSGGWVVAADLDDGIDVYLSAVPNQNTGVLNGIIPILSDWQVQPLTGTTIDYPIGQNQLPAPGTITVGAI
jgi:uncharacterized phage protein gp47/JayE